PADAAAVAASASDAEYVADEILVTFDAGVGAREAAAAIAAVPQADEAATAEAADLAVLDAPDAAGSDEPVVVKLDEDADAQRAVADALAQPGVAAAQLNYRYSLLETPAVGSQLLAAGSTGLTSQSTHDALTNDPALASYDPKADENAWHLQAIDIESAWEQVKCQGSVTVAVLDTGCDIGHEDLADNVIADYAWNAYKGEPLNCDYYGHGTHVAGCIAAAANNAAGTAGSSYNAKVLPVNVFDAYGSDQWSSTTKALVSAYDYLLELDEEHPELNIHVVNMSLGGYGSQSADDLALQDRIAKAKERDIVSVCAGGNGTNGVPNTAGHYPSDYADCVAVTALSTDGYTPTTWCDYNAQKDICVPGEDIYSTVPLYCKMEGNANWWAYESVSGTSMATPVAAGVFALLWAARPELTVDEAIAAVKGTASNRLQIPDEWYSQGRTPNLYGTGVLSAGNAVGYVKQLPPSQKLMAALGVAADEGESLLTTAVASVDGADVLATASWVPTAVHESLVSAIAAARSLVAAGGSYEQVVSARDVLTQVGLAFRDARAEGLMQPATAQARNELRTLARNAQVDMQGVAVSADGLDVPVGGLWAPTAVTERLSSAIAAAEKLLSGDAVGADAVEAARSELAEARKAFNDNVAEAPEPASGEDHLALLATAIDQAEQLLASAVASADGADVLPTAQWVPQDAHDAFAAAIAAARDLAVAGCDADQAAAARASLAEVGQVFADARVEGTMQVATAQARSALRILARNAKLDTAGITTSADGADVLVGQSWVSPAAAERLSAAIAVADSLVAAGNAVAAKAVQEAYDELVAARSNYAQAVQTAKAPASDGGEGTGSESGSGSGSGSDSESGSGTNPESGSGTKPAVQKKTVVSINKATVNVAVVKQALAKANNPSAATITLGPKVKKIAKGAFKGTKAKTLVVKTKKLKKASVKGCLSGSKISTIKVKLGAAKANNAYVKKYEKLFTKKIAGKKAAVKR
ncbi:MAG TPA: hypothetical protein DCP91_08470, partial [Eggerthellaceae bacterium]|nr:hypothetical protein [Eggerthellaceae bacterium]